MCTEPETPPPPPTEPSFERLLATLFGFKTQTKDDHGDDLGSAEELEERRQAEIARRLNGPPAPDYSDLVLLRKLLTPDEGPVAGADSEDECGDHTAVS